MPLHNSLLWPDNYKRNIIHSLEQPRFVFPENQHRNPKFAGLASWFSIYVPVRLLRFRANKRYKLYQWHQHGEYRYLPFFKLANYYILLSLIGKACKSGITQPRVAPTIPQRRGTIPFCQMRCMQLSSLAAVESLLSTHSIQSFPYTVVSSFPLSWKDWARVIKAWHV